MPWETCAKCNSGSYYPESGGFCRYCSAPIVPGAGPTHPVGRATHPGTLEDCAAPSCSPAPAPFDLLEFYARRAEWSAQTFGPGDRAKGVVAHIRKELVEIEAKPSDLEEWVDLVFLAMDGAWRSAGADGPRFVAALQAKHAKNAARTWPDRRTAGPDQPIEHVRTDAELAGAAKLPADPADLTRERIVAAAERAERSSAAAAQVVVADHDPDRFVEAVAAVGERVQRVQIASGSALDAIGEALDVKRWSATWPEKRADDMRRAGMDPLAEDDASYRRRLRQAAAAEYHAGTRRVAYQTGEDFAHEVLADVHAGAAAARAKIAAELRGKVADVLDEITEVAELCASDDGDTPRADLVVNLAGMVRERVMGRLG